MAQKKLLTMQNRMHDHRYWRYLIDDFELRKSQQSSGDWVISLTKFQFESAAHVMLHLIATVMIRLAVKTRYIGRHDLDTACMLTGVIPMQVCTEYVGTV